MASSKISDLIGREVERMFGEISAKRGDLCTNPVTGGGFVYGLDPLRLQKKICWLPPRRRNQAMENRRAA